MVSVKVYGLSGGVCCTPGFRNEPKLQSVCVCARVKPGRPAGIVTLLLLPSCLCPHRFFTPFSLWEEENSQHTHSPTWRSCSFYLAILQGDKPIDFLVPSPAGVQVPVTWVKRTRDWGTGRERHRHLGAERESGQEPVGWIEGAFPCLSWCQSSCAGDTVLYLSSPPSS